MRMNVCCRGLDACIEVSYPLSASVRSLLSAAVMEYGVAVADEERSIKGAGMTFRRLTSIMP